MPNLTQNQLEENIDSLLDQNAPRDLIQEYINTVSITKEPKVDANLDQSNQIDRQESLLDQKEELSRPSGLQVAGDVVSGSLKETVDFLKGVASVVSNPKDSVKKIKDFVKNTSSDEAKEIIKFIVSDTVEGFGQTFGYEKDRGFDLDVAIKQWRESPTESIGNALIIWGLARSGVNSVLTGPTSLRNKRMAKKAIDNLGDEGKDMNKVLSDIRRSKELEITSEKVVDSVDRMSDNWKSIKKMSIPQLDSDTYMQNRSKSFANTLEAISKKDREGLSKSVEKLKDFRIKLSPIRNKVMVELNEQGLGSVQDVIDGIGKEFKLSKSQAKLNRLQSALNGESISVKEVHNLIKYMDDRINWNDFKEVDRGLKVLRGNLRTRLGEIDPKGYGYYSSRIHKRLKATDNLEDKLRRGKTNVLKAKDREALVANITNSKQASDTMENVLKELVNDGSKKARISKGLAESALKEFEFMKGWRSWNSHYGHGSKFFDVNDGTFRGIVAPVVTGVSKRLRKHASYKGDLTTIPKSIGLGVYASESLNPNPN